MRYTYHDGLGVVPHPETKLDWMIYWCKWIIFIGIFIWMVSQYKRCTNATSQLKEHHTLENITKDV